ncbi:hypothetical protein RVR_4436 [Actinacidiphila reveromycinica]|uniref:Uncharacterized protein n=1 Tax=Actinacidiphila reveromycinica TaxID=659352 RepID=A0A7U3UT84_9ACTN|nr:hypothetical protein [Streptomyces sp. SN-593]BBA98303.1 hypothetical protein RVR_4436 [Streptomyces sp. SN-593]
MNSTDQKTAQADETASAVLRAVADHFTDTNPTDVLEQHSLLVCVGAEAYRLTERRSDGSGQALSKAALATMPEVPAGITRGEFALHLRRAAASHEWTSDDNERVIPTIPAPRKAPVPAQPQDGER